MADEIPTHITAKAKPLLFWLVEFLIGIVFQALEKITARASKVWKFPRHAGTLGA
jgi:hypothetical protein